MAGPLRPAIRFSNAVMTALVPAIHALLEWIKKNVDARHEAGHDEERETAQRGTTWLI
jgi:hypothetical protein